MSTAFASGKVHDFRLYKQSKLALPKQVCCLADTGYQGLTEQKALNRQLAQQRVFCEHTIRKLKVFRILSARYRNRRKRFGLRFNLIAALCNLELQL